MGWGDFKGVRSGVERRRRGVRSRTETKTSVLYGKSAPLFFSCALSSSSFFFSASSFSAHAFFSSLSFSSYALSRSAVRSPRYHSFFCTDSVSSLMRAVPYERTNERRGGVERRQLELKGVAVGD
eukprot:31209-Pelagococcus_subviridis.AAC.1